MKAAINNCNNGIPIHDKINQFYNHKHCQNRLSSQEHRVLNFTKINIRDHPILSMMIMAPDVFPLFQSTMTLTIQCLGNRQLKIYKAADGEGSISKSVFNCSFCLSK